MRNKGKRGGGAVDSDDSQSQVMSPRLPQTPNVTDPTASVSAQYGPVSGQHGSVPLPVSPGSVSQNTNTFIASSLPVGSTRFSQFFDWMAGRGPRCPPVWSEGQALGAVFNQLVRSSAQLLGAVVCSK